MKQSSRVANNSSKPVRALLPSLALSLHPEGADMGSVSLVVGGGSGQPHEEVTGSLSLSYRSTWLRLRGQLEERERERERETKSR